MPFREKMRSLVKTRSRGDTLTRSDTGGSPDSRERWPSNVYKPGETMPRPKYRAPPKKEHKEKLESFSFADAWRRKSFQSAYSPMGTRAPSRATSVASISKRSMGRRSSMKSTRTDSVTSAETEKSGVKGGRNLLSRLNTQAEQEGDDDVTNVGMSRVQSKDHHPTAFSRPMTAENERMMPSIHQQASDHLPFTEEELRLAMQRSHLAVPAHG